MPCSPCPESPFPWPVSPEASAGRPAELSAAAVPGTADLSDPDYPCCPADRPDSDRSADCPGSAAVVAAAVVVIIVIIKVIIII